MAIPDVVAHNLLIRGCKLVKTGNMGVSSEISVALEVVSEDCAGLEKSPSI